VIQSKVFFSKLAGNLTKRSDQTDDVVVLKIKDNVRVIKDFLTKVKTEKTPVHKEEYDFIRSALANMESANREVRKEDEDTQTWPNLDLELLSVGQDSFQVYFDTAITESEKLLASAKSMDYFNGLSGLIQFSKQHPASGWDNTLKMAQAKLNLIEKYEKSDAHQQFKYMDQDRFSSMKANVEKNIDELSKLYKADPQPPKKEVVDALLEQFNKLGN